MVFAMKTSNVQVNEDVEALRHDVHRLREDLVRTVNSLRLRGRNTVMDTRDRMRNMMTDLQDRARERLRAGSDVLKDRGHDLVDRYRGRLQRRPLTTVLAAFAIGMAVAAAVAVLRRRH
jgi:ElaB/YqjD/DUF883 family membrane-anchored ribosome-binding protein